MLEYKDYHNPKYDVLCETLIDCDMVEDEEVFKVI